MEDLMDKDKDRELAIEQLKNADSFFAFTVKGEEGGLFFPHDNRLDRIMVAAAFILSQNTAALSMVEVMTTGARRLLKLYGQEQPEHGSVAIDKVDWTFNKANFKADENQLFGISDQPKDKE
jgi:hypothetical protein